MESVKQCTKCLQTKSLAFYSKHNGAKASKSGYRATCKQCDIEANRIYRANNREKVNAAKREWAARNPESKRESDRRYRLANLEARTAYIKAWYANNSEWVREYRAKPEVKAKKAELDRKYAKNNPHINRAASQRYRQNNPKKAAETARNYRQRNPELMRNKTHKRRALIAAQSFIVSKKELRRLLEATCFYCNAAPATQLDHIIPIARGGNHSIGNLIGACPFCNASKGSRFITEWRKKQHEQKGNKTNIRS